MKAGKIMGSRSRGVLAGNQLRSRPIVQQTGMTLIEVLITLAIFSIVMVGVHAAYQQQAKYTNREYRLAEADIELGIAGRIIERDISMAGYGLAHDYRPPQPPPPSPPIAPLFNPKAVLLHNIPTALTSAGPPVNFNVTADSAPDNDADVLRLMGTGLGLESRASGAWSYMGLDAGATELSFRQLGDVREDVRSDASGNDVVTLMEPTTRKILMQGADWQFIYDATQTGDSRLKSIPTGTPFSSPSVGVVLYALHTSGSPAATQPYYSVQYYLGAGTSPKACAPGTRSLLRAEDRTAENPTGGAPLLSCVLDFQVALGLDTDEDENINFYESVGGTAVGYDPKELARRLKQVRVYILVQAGAWDPDYQYPDSNIFVGDLDLGVGRQITLTEAQRRYRWRVISLAVVPVNIR